ncbi:hypothetical protein D0466_00380 [Peribacillus glennii]|uniref:Uncharacterized protein n=1 Tax=Peribacillus glennii TaxID=2303991 RepID=A0A372LJI3_9BACI|nr:hypothetical protein D0466_00380 [Peribacillus glennii]
MQASKPHRQARNPWQQWKKSHPPHKRFPILRGAADDTGEIQNVFYIKKEKAAGNSPAAGIH